MRYRLDTISSMVDLPLKQLEPLVQGCNRNSLLCKSRSLTSFYVLTIGLCRDTLVTDRITFVALDLLFLSMQ
jgi:hypothetical protein